MSARWEHFPHEADVGVRGIGKTVADAFAQAAVALTAAVCHPAAVRPVDRVEIRCAAEDLEDLLYEWLNAVVYEMATRRMLFGRFDVTIEAGVLHGVAWGEPVSRDRHQPAVEVKAATYAGLRVREQEGEWIAECVVDV